MNFHPRQPTLAAVKSTPPIPPGSHTLTPYLTVTGAENAIDFYRRAFDARELCRYFDAEGRIGHAELQIGDSRLYLSDEFQEWGALSPATLGGAATALRIYVPDADATFARAVAAGATVVRPMNDEFYGDRCGKIQDPFGYKWIVATHREDVPPHELGRRARESYGMTYSCAASAPAPAG